METPVFNVKRFLKNNGFESFVWGSDVMYRNAGPTDPKAINIMDNMGRGDFLVMKPRVLFTDTMNFNSMENAERFLQHIKTL